MSSERKNEPDRKLGEAQAGLLRALGILCIPDLDEELEQKTREKLIELGPRGALALEIVTDSVRLHRLTQKARDDVCNYIKYAIRYLDKVAGEYPGANICATWRSTLSSLSLAQESIESAIGLAEATLEALGTPAPPEDER